MHALSIFENDHCHKKSPKQSVGHTPAPKACVGHCMETSYKNIILVTVGDPPVGSIGIRVTREQE